MNAVSEKLFTVLFLKIKRQFFLCVLYYFTGSSPNVVSGKVGSFLRYFSCNCFKEPAFVSKLSGLNRFVVCVEIYSASSFFFSLSRRKCLMQPIRLHWHLVSEWINTNLCRMNPLFKCCRRKKETHNYRRVRSKIKRNNFATIFRLIKQTLQYLNVQVEFFVYVRQPHP